MAQKKQTTGELLRQARMEAGFTQEKAAERLGLQQRQVSRDETTRLWGEWPRLRQYAKLYGVQPDELKGD